MAYNLSIGCHSGRSHEAQGNLASQMNTSPLLGGTEPGLQAICFTLRLLSLTPDVFINKSLIPSEVKNYKETYHKENTDKFVLKI